MKKRNYSVIAKVLVVSSLMCGVLSSCSEVYDDSELLKKLEELENKLDQHEKSDVAPEDSIIHFDDVAVKAICVSHWDTNHDGELSYAEAAKVDTIGSEFSESSIYMFKELKYFSNLLHISSGYSGGFYYCEQLKIISIPSSVVSIGGDAFRIGGRDNWRGGEFVVHIDDIEAWCNIYFRNYYSNPLSRSRSNLYVNGELLTDLIIPNSITGVKDYAFGGCQSLISVLIPEGITYIGKGAFEDCSNLDSITIPKSVTNIGGSAFDGTSWLANQPDGMININNMLYKYKCHDSELPENASIEIPSGITKICGYAFYGYRYGEYNRIAYVCIPESVTEIGASAFAGCYNLTSITIPKSVTMIGDGAFEACTKLNAITVLNTTPPLLERDKEGWERVFYSSCYEDATLYVPKGCVEVYRNADGWGDFVNIVELE